MDIAEERRGVLRQAPGLASDCSTVGPYRSGRSEVEMHEVVMVRSDPTGLMLGGKATRAGVLDQRGVATKLLIRIHWGHE